MSTQCYGYHMRFCVFFWSLLNTLTATQIYQPGSKVLGSMQKRMGLTADKGELTSLLTSSVTQGK